MKIIYHFKGCGCGATNSKDDYGARGPWIDSLLSGWLFMQKHLRMAFSGYQDLPFFLTMDTNLFRLIIKKMLPYLSVM
jgi:hypothetical protein